MTNVCHSAAKGTIVNQLVLEEPHATCTKLVWTVADLNQCQE